MSADTTTKPAFDRQGDQGDEARVDAAMRTFVSEFGITAAVHIESCVKNAACAPRPAISTAPPATRSTRRSTSSSPSAAPTSSKRARWRRSCASSA